MKCTNCGKNEVNFYYESNVNGKVTRQQLCSECAQKLGFGTGSFFDGTEDMFSSMFSDFFSTRRRAFPSLGTFTMPSLLLPSLFAPQTAQKPQETSDSCQCGDCQTQSQPQQTQTGDTEMNKRRQINMLRAKMQDAIYDENFEEAAKLRDQIHELEK